MKCRMLCCFLLAQLACSRSELVPPTPAVPSAVPASATVAPPAPALPSGTPVATLEVSTFIVWPRAVARPNEYDIELRLHETSGRSGATLQSVVLGVARDDGRGDTDSGCVPPPTSLARIPAGQTWDLATLGYCAPEVPNQAGVTRVTFQATFTDDLGRSGRVQSTAEVTR